MSGKESADYGRGYAAGRRREDRDERERERNHALMMARYALTAAIAPEIIRRPWQRDGQPLTTRHEIAGTIAGIVREIERQL